MPDQENYGRFTQGAWNFIKSVRLEDEEADRLRLMIEAKTESSHWMKSKLWCILWYVTTRMLKSIYRTNILI